MFCSLGGGGHLCGMYGGIVGTPISEMHCKFLME